LDGAVDETTEGESEFLRSAVAAVLESCIYGYSFVL
jgi:hypothetical protein